MKKTIKDDQNRLILKSEMINDNALLEVVADEGYIFLSVRYVKYAKINEVILLKMDIVDYMKNQENLIEFNEDKSAIAIFRPHEEGFAIDNVYDLVNHESSGPSDAKYVYPNKFKKILVKYYLKQK